MTDQLSQTCDAIVATVRIRDDFMRAENRLILQIKSLCRRLAGADYPPGDRDKATLSKIRAEGNRIYKALVKDPASDPRAQRIHSTYLTMGTCRDTLHKERVAAERQLRNLAKTLPVWPWIEADVRGMGDLGLGVLIGETGDLRNYDTVSKVWKRMGVGMIQNEKGEWVRQRRYTDKAMALKAGYNPRRRSVMFNLGESFVKQGDSYRALYDEFKKKALEDKGWTKGHAHEHAMRLVGKEFLKRLWVQWRDAEKAV